MTKPINPLRETVGILFFLLCILIFAWWVQGDGLLKVGALVALVVCCLQAGWFYASGGPETWGIYSLRPVSKHFLALGITLLVATILASGYRQASGFGYMPQSLHSFAFIAIAIGTTEEIVFRGYLQQRMSIAIKKPGIIIVLSAMAHALYKMALFASGYAMQCVDLMSMLLYTALAGFALAAVTMHTRSVWIAVAAHALFDLVVYGNASAAPWWVW